MTEPSQYFKGRTVQEQMDEVIGYVDVRSAEVATDAIASDVAQVHQDMLDADADAAAAAASAAAAAETLANAVKKTGEASQSIAGDIAVAGTLSGGTVTVPTPVNNTDAANKKYVDDKDALDVHLAGAETITGVKQVPLETTGTFSNQIASSNKLKNELDNYAPMVRTTGNQTIDGTKSFISRIIEKTTLDWSVDGFVSPISRSLFEADDGNSTVLYENSITKENANTQRQDIRQRVSKDGTNGNRIDVYFRTTIDASTETVTLQLFILVYENGMQVRGKAQQIAQLTAV